MARPLSIKEYIRPESLYEVSEILLSRPDETRLLAGGTDLLQDLPPAPDRGVRIVSLKNIRELRGVRKEPDGRVLIGAMASHREINESPLIESSFPALAEACGLVGSPSIRNLGTIGGNLATASPSADSIPPLMAYDAEIILWASAGERKVRVEDFFTGPSRTIMQPGEILKGILLRPRPGRIADYEKLGIRKAMEIAIVNVCVSLVPDKMNRCTDPRIALGAVAPTPIRAGEAEELLRGEPLTAESIQKAAGAAMEAAEPISDIRASAGYRRHMVGVLVEKLLFRFLKN